LASGVDDARRIYGRDPEVVNRDNAISIIPFDHCLKFSSWKGKETTARVVGDDGIWLSIISGVEESAAGQLKVDAPQWVGKTSAQVGEELQVISEANFKVAIELAS